MANVTRQDVEKAVLQLGIRKGDIVMVHSSFKSMGTVEGGAESVIGGFLDAVGTEGTLVLPAFTMKDFGNAYRDWHMNKPSDAGYLTEYFRTREGTCRSDQATHSVCAFGKMAEELTKTHGHTHKRFGNAGETPFSADSPFQKMYDNNARIVMLGVSTLYITFRHFAEYCYMEKELDSIKAHPDFQMMKDQLWAFGKKGVWPHLHNLVLTGLLNEKGLVYRSKCGNATFTSVPVREFVDLAMQRLQDYDPIVLRRCDSVWDTDAWIKWTERVREMREELK
ncbi:MAG: AAC(3) family N-acetyltransferase [Ruminococcaceae bacterium]|nr:AAC(3) family N-acetyltransferase [Oscillospiraceae bacterium]